MRMRSAVVIPVVCVSAAAMVLVGLASRAGAAGAVVVSVGYADSTAGLVPWSGSPNTIFIGEPPACCATHGPNNGQPTYDGGALEVSNNTNATITLNALTVDFGGGSDPSNFDLWGGGGSGTLPMSVAPGQQVVMTMTDSFNFDSSDLFGEACHADTGVIPIVHVTVNGATTDYDDSNQVLNTGGTDLAACPGDGTEQIDFTPISAGNQTAAGPVNMVPPAIAGPAIQSRVLSALPGGWHASPPPTLTTQWLRCDSSGANCTSIGGATAATYVPVLADVGSTLRAQVTATNTTGTVSLPSAATSVIVAGPTLVQLGDTSTGFTSNFVTGTTPTVLSSLATATVTGTTNDFEFYARGAGNTQDFTPTLYASAANGSRGSLLATGSAVTVPIGTDARWYATTLPSVTLTAGKQYYLVLTSSGDWNGTYVGSELDGTNSFFVDYTPAGTVAPDTTPPSTPTGLTVGTVTSTQVNLSWTASTDNVAVAGYRIYRGGVQVGTSMITSFADIGLTPGVTYDYYVVAYDSSGNLSTQSLTAEATTPIPPPDTTPPSAPGNLTATAISTTQVNLAWTASTDNVGVVGYKVFRNGVQIAVTMSTSYPDSGLSANTAYTYTVTAYDAAGNSASASTTVTTPAVSKVSFVQGAASSTDATATTIAQPLSTAVTLHDLIAVAVSWGNNATISCSDTLGNAYTVVTTQYDATNQQSLGICYAPNSKAGADTVTVLFSKTAGYRHVSVSEYAGILTISPVDISATNLANGTTAANAITSTAKATTTAGDLIFGATMDDTGTTSIGAGAGFTQRTSVNGKDMVTQDLVQVSAGSVSSTMTFGAAHRYLAQLVAFKPAT